MSLQLNCPKCGHTRPSKQGRHPASGQKSKFPTQVTEPNLADFSEYNRHGHSADRQSYFTTTEAAEYLRVSKQFLEIARHRGGGPRYVKLARAVRYFKPSLDQWMLARERDHTAEGEV